MDNFNFMDSWPAWVRWVAVVVIPGAVYGLTVWLFLGVFVANWGSLGEHVSFRYLEAMLLGLIALGSFLFVWCGVALAPRLKLAVALLLGFLAVALGSRSFLVFVYFVLGGVVIAWGLALWGYLRRRQAGLASRATNG